MKDKRLKDLIAKYQETQSRTAEERLLRERIDKSDPAMHSWSKFVNAHKAKVPEQFTDKQWEKFNKHIASTPQFVIRIVSIAASILVLMTLYFSFSNPQDELSYEEKASLLKQAKNMLPEQNQEIATQDIIYEDHSIIIYTTTEKNLNND